jgi:hypothetical protein
VADPGERLDRPVRDAVEHVRRISEPLRERPAHLEVVLALGLLGDVLVHVLDLRLELAGVYRRSCRFHLCSFLGIAPG